MSTLHYPEHVHSLADYIEEVFAAHGDKATYTALGQTLTYAEIERHSRAVAAYFLEKAGLRPGDRVAIQLPNLIQNPIAVYGALRAGLVVVNTNPLYTEREMRHQFTDSGAKALVILDDLMPKFEAIQVDTAIETVITTSATELLDNSTAPARQDAIALSQVLAEGADTTLPKRPDSDLDELCMLQYTGGTTGVSKGAALSHRNVLANSLQTLGRLGGNFRDGKEVVICPLPLYHIYAFTVCMVAFFAKGSHIVLIPNPRDIDGFIATLKNHTFTTFAGINTLFVGLGRHPDFARLDFSKLHLTLSGGTALTQAAVNIWKEVTGCMITEGYGLSETAPVLCFNHPGKEEIGTVGPPLEETEIRLLDSHDKPVEGDEPGQIAARGPQVMLGYWQRDDETANVMTADGFFKTGDIGVRTASGAIQIVDRLKDMILVSGFNVYPNEVEEVLTSHPSVMEAAVVGKPDERTGEQVCAFITVSEDVSEEDIMTHCRESLTSYKLPRSITVMDELPKSTVGKILRRSLRD
ncbi:AMP-binding protein [Alteromonas halophila]|uniref:Long-chain-fatty-acid--CoA ligase n=1 Tax=Alteromonas halophila TaxID=516698 RepID=A0A918JH60_9ALTE|nr:AMP-binding protein [Alteromonas halophila]GGW80678.1 long-chain-fatty-acid--CoA ligase [Alteromonas halophila]